MAQQSSIPTSRLNRMFRLGKMASGVAGAALNEGLKRLARGDMPRASELLLTPGNARRMADQLAEMRGAVMKIGQLLSMEAGDLLPRELTDILSRLRDNAHSMPRDQLHRLLKEAWGDDWRDRFQQFDEEPFAAASIGQVHRAVHRSGQRLAIKIQYPGIAASIDSDVDNAVSLLRLFRLVPAELDIESLLDTAKQQLHDEADYRLEARHLKIYRQHLGEDAHFQVPEVLDSMTTENILVMSFVDGEGIEQLTYADAELRNRLATKIVELSLKEFLHWGTVQTDANFGNFRFDAAQQTVGLLDFGALRINSVERTEAFSRLLKAAMDYDLPGVAHAACDVGYIQKQDPFNYRLAMVDLVQTAAEPANHEGTYDFAQSTLSQRLSEKLFHIRRQKGFQRIPPADVIFLHRKLAGIYLLCAKIGARVDVRACIESVLTKPPEPLAVVPAVSQA